MNIWQFIKATLGICDHAWVFVRTTDDQNLRTGHKHSSDIFRCDKCGKHETREHA